MKLHDLAPQEGATTKRKRVGRGFGSGHGKTATRGYNGQGQRSGESKKIGFEGGQMPLFRRTPKKHHFQRPLRYLARYAEINVGRLDETFDGTSPITEAHMAEVGLVPASLAMLIDESGEPGEIVTVLKARYAGVRVLGVGDVTKPLEVHACHFTKAAKEKIEAAGGKCFLVDLETEEAAAE